MENEKGLWPYHEEEHTDMPYSVACSCGSLLVGSIEEPASFEAHLQFVQARDERKLSECQSKFDYKELAKIWYKHFEGAGWNTLPPEPVVIEYSKEMISYIVKEIENGKI